MLEKTKNIKNDSVEQIEIDFSNSLDNETNCIVYNYNDFCVEKENNRRKELISRFREFSNSLEW